MVTRTRYRRVTVTLPLTVDVDLLVSNIPEDPENPDGLDDQWDVEGIVEIRHAGDHTWCSALEAMTDEVLEEIDEKAGPERDLQEKEYNRLLGKGKK